MSNNTISQENDLHISILDRAQIGTVSGLAGGFAIFFIIFIIDFQLRQIPGTFYKMIGFPVGLEGISATLFGMVSHMVTAALIGTVFCVCSGLHQKLDLSTTNKGIIAGGTTGITVYFLFFIPITMLVIRPLIEQGTQNELGLVATISNIESIHLLQNMSLIVLGASIVHILFGVIMGFIATLFLEKTKMSYFRKDKTLTVITLVIITGIVGIGIFYGIIANYTPMIQQNELAEELAKIEPGLTYSKFINMDEDRRLAIIAQMSLNSRDLILKEAKKFDTTIDEDMSEIASNLESSANLKFLQSAQISGIKGNIASGKVWIISNGYTTYLRLENLEVVNGIDQHIYLTKAGDIVNGIDIGKLKAGQGNQNYQIKGIDSNEYNQMIIYSKSFDKYYASAILTKSDLN